MKAWLWQRVPDCCRTPGHMKRAYYDVMRRDVLMVAWPLNYVVQAAYWALGHWNGYRMAPSWMDGELDRLRRENRELLGALEGLVRVNELWNESVEDVIGRPPQWNDSYLDVARRVIARARKAEGAK